MRRLVQDTIVSAALFFLLSSSALAQRMGAAAHFSGRPGPYFSHPNHSGLYPASFAFFDPLYSDYFSGYPEPPQPPVVLLQSPPAAEPARIPAEPLMIELQGNRYVQISGDQPSHSLLIDTIPAPSATRSTPAPRSSLPSSSPPPQPTAVLIFRDGHREEISGYTITDGILYASADYYRSGYWNRKIALSSLDLSDTVDTNQTRGVPFRIPSASNEVIVGP
jgi:hypothetical protein